MGWYVETLITFDAEGDEVQNIAQETIDKPDSEWSREALIILSSIASGHGYTCGPKGGVWAIAFTGNHTNGEHLAKELIPFFQKLWGKPKSEGSRIWDGPMLNFYHATIITQDEQTGHSRIFVIKVPGVVEEHEGPEIWHEE